MDWLREFHRRWQNARGRRLASASRGFSQDWPKLLDAAGIARAEDIATAVREAVALEKSGHLVLKRHRYRNYLIERVTLPLEKEEWLMAQFGGVSGGAVLLQALEVVERFSRRGNSRFPEFWKSLCDTLDTVFREGRALRPFSWKQAATLDVMLGAIASLSEAEWAPGTLIRSASVAIGRDSKWLERHRRSCEAGLTRLLGENITLRSLGLVDGDASVELSGPVCLHFPDGTSHDFDGLSHPIISAADLERCSSISTTAERLLSIENRKTTFRQYAAANTDRRTLIATSSFPTPAFRQFLTKLPTDLPLYHFGDTDPSGWHILLKLREAAGRSVAAYCMKWRPAAVANPLTQHDRKLLGKLLDSPLLDDVRGEIEIMVTTGDRGDYEQETL